MIYRIHNGNNDDYFDVEADTIEEIRAIVSIKEKQLCWKDCWSEKIK